LRPDWSAATIMRGAYALGDTRAVRAYCRGVIVAAALAGVIVLIAAGLTWAAHLVHMGQSAALLVALGWPHPMASRPSGQRC
jgi:hypothetical protein